MEFYNYLRQDHCESFFLHLAQRIRRQVDAHKSNRRMRKFAARRSVMTSTEVVDVAEETDETDALCISSLVGLLQELCEGHNLLMQDLLRDQVTTAHYNVSYNLIEEAVALLQVLCKKEQRIAALNLTEALQVLSVLELFIEVMQGPCLQNQAYLASSFMVTACKNLLSNTPGID